MGHGPLIANLAAGRSGLDRPCAIGEAIARRLSNAFEAEGEEALMTPQTHRKDALNLARRAKDKAEEKQVQGAAEDYWTALSCSMARKATLDAARLLCYEAGSRSRSSAG